jgi:hypothetical protein
MHELNHDQPKITKELLNITTSHASGKEVVGAIFMQSSGKAAPVAVEGHQPRQPTRMKRGVLEVTRGGRSGDPVSHGHH